MQLTEHASARANQRGVPKAIIETIFVFGSEQHAPGGTTRLTLDDASICLAADGSAHRQAQLERYRHTYLVIGDDGRVVTVARKRRHFFT
jgi:hypothetical protein